MRAVAVLGRCTLGTVVTGQKNRLPMMPLAYIDSVAVKECEGEHGQ